jgi:hypothetical protein
VPSLRTCTFTVPAGGPFRAPGLHGADIRPSHKSSHHIRVPTSTFAATHPRTTIHAPHRRERTLPLQRPHNSDQLQIVTESKGHTGGAQPQRRLSSCTALHLHNGQQILLVRAAYGLLQRANSMRHTGRFCICTVHLTAVSGVYHTPRRITLEAHFHVRYRVQ